MGRLRAAAVVVLIIAASSGHNLAWAGDGESAAATATRENLKQKISIDSKDLPFRVLIDEINGAMDKGVNFRIDNVSGLSNNTRVTYSCKNKSAEEILNDLSDKMECGWYVISDAKDRKDGFVVLRKCTQKERGYKDGRDPKK